MKLSAYAVTSQFAYYRITMMLTIILHSITDVTYTITRLGLFYAEHKRLFGSLEQFQNFFFYLSYHKGIATVTIETIQHSATIAAYYISFFQDIIRRESVHDFVIDFDTQSTRETFISLKTGNSSMVSNKLLCNLIKTSGSNAWLNPLGDFAKRLSNQVVSLTHQFDFLVSLQKYHFLKINKRQQNQNGP